MNIPQVSFAPGWIWFSAGAEMKKRDPKDVFVFASAGLHAGLRRFLLPLGGYLIFFSFFQRRCVHLIWERLPHVKRGMHNLSSSRLYECSSRAFRQHTLEGVRYPSHGYTG